MKSSFWNLYCVASAVAILSVATIGRADQVVSAVVVRSFHLNDATEAVFVKLGFGADFPGGPLNGELFKTRLLTTNSVGQVFEANLLNEPKFGSFARLLTDGVQESVTVQNSNGAFNSSLERTFFDPLPSGGNGVDLEGYAITNVTMSVDGVVLSPDANFGGFTCVYSISYRVFGYATPKLYLNRLAPGNVQVSWSTNSNASAFVLQETASLVAPAWSNAASGSTNPAVFSNIEGIKFFRLIRQP